MAEFIMLVGIPGCGKSTLCEKYRAKGYKIHSSDAIRNELDMHKPEDTTEVFNILHNRIKADMELGLNIIYDATNLSRKLRWAYLQTIKKYDYHKTCLLFIVPIDVCKERNSHRTGYAKVPDFVYDRMLRAFNLPTKEEGWDNIIPILYNGEIEFEYDFDNLMNFSQDNHHHSLTLGEHMNKAYEYVCNKTDDYVIRMATKYHDIGKIYTKKFVDKNNNPTEEAHYYGHDNYGAYVWMVYWLSKYRNKMSFNMAMRIGQLINWHMTPLLRWEKYPHTIKKDKRYISEIFYNQVNLLHEADMYAH
ncbi:MAG: ATP-binding protein [Bacilli bacterium]|nr:ATP-binding protein [Bacilli bacterium]